MGSIKKIFAALALLVAFASGSNAQETVKSLPGATLTELTSHESYVVESSLNYSRTSDAVTASGKQVRLKKAAELPLVGVFRSDKNGDFDTFVVTYKGKDYAIIPEQTENSDLVERKKLSIKGFHESYRKDVEQAARAFTARLEELRDRCAFRYDSLELAIKELEYERDSEIEQERIKSYAKADSLEKAAQARLEKELADWQVTRDRWERNLSPAARKAVNAVIIAGPWLSEANSAGGHDASIVYYNTSKKTIKYFKWTMRCKNAVNDYVNCEIRGSRPMILNDTGPIEPGGKGGGTWENVIYNWTAESAVLSNIAITYMDGSTVSLTPADLAASDKAFEQLPDKPETDLREYNAELEKHMVRFRVLEKSIMDSYAEKSKDMKEELYKNDRMVNYFKSGNDVTDYVFMWDKDIAGAVLDAKEQMKTTKEALKNFEHDNLLNYSDPETAIIDAWLKKNAEWKEGQIKKAAKKAADEALQRVLCYKDEELRIFENNQPNNWISKI